ncbi:protein red1 [Echria macrotheca]|uniref:Protein red1 n=1 Tax=Echria macrotheca TaxID=438768 RepID=A0AAJ0BI64_9PEZI|nr:protein red1 [Echria macrotheca]
MSQYPSYPYGYSQHHGPPPPSQPSAQQNFTATPYPPPSYGQPPYDPRVVENNLAVTQNAFGFNSNSIPGLGIGGPPPPALNLNIVPASGMSTQPPVRPQTEQATSTRPAPSSSAYPTGSWAAPSPTHNSTSPRSTDPVPPKKRAEISKPVFEVSDIEEGELSEGQFEDLYETKDPEENAAARPPPAKAPSTALTSQQGSRVDTPDPGFYGNDEEEGEVVTDDKRDAATTRERSGSYSPFLSPREIQTENTTPQEAAGEEDGPSSPFLASSHAPTLKTASNTQGGAQPNPIVPGLQYSSQPAINSSRPDGLSLSASNSHNNGPSGAFSSLSEAKKEAQKSILRLWPIGVKYQNYLDEGFDEQIIKSLFGELHLEMPKKPVEPPKVSKPTPREQNNDVPPPTAQQSASNKKDSSAKPSGQGKAEERKDRIARLLAAKAAKGPTPSGSGADVSKPAAPQMQPTESGPANTQAQKTKQWGEKEFLLQKKIAALQKSREAQAQKAVAEGGNGGIPSTVLYNGHGVPINPVLNKYNQKSGVKPPQPPQQDSARPSSLQNLLPASAAKPIIPTGPRKRPAAADFISYSSPEHPPKRPFGHNRKETSVIIDVSDDSDNEEMDMDMEASQEDSFTRQGSAFASRGPAVRDFPPLTNTPPPRPFSGPVSASKTPPIGRASGRGKKAELDLKERAIQEMKRKIAEAEARRKAKKSSVCSTPNPAESDSSSSPLKQGSRFAGPAPNISAGTSFELPKRTEKTLSQEPGGTDRRGRIVSLELPRIKESLEEKLERLRQIREEELRLQAEIDEQLAQEQLLTKELEQMDVNSVRSLPQQNGLGSNGDPVNSPPTETPPEQQVSSMSEEPSPASGPTDDASDVSMDEDESSRESSPEPNSSRETSQPHQGDENDQLAATLPSPSHQDAENDQTAATLSESEIQSHREKESGALPDAGALEMATPVLNLDSAVHVSSSIDPVTDINTGAADMEKEPQPETISSGMLDEADKGVENEVPDDGGLMEADKSSPDPVSDTQSREQSQEVVAAPTGEMPTVSISPSEQGFTPYQSPLRYFLAYRYHPDFLKTVPGGLRSLTYSNMIDPKATMCPYELSGQACPEGCGFQHFKSIILGAPVLAPLSADSYHFSVPDEQILVELGRSDDYTGERRSLFIQGLREVLQDFRLNKVKDFDTLARGIIDYRSRFLGDKSRILPLEGVTL